MTVRTVAMLTAGGLAPCLSSAVGGLIERYTEVAPDVRLIAYTNGYAGLLRGDTVEVTPEVRQRAHLLHGFGGSPIGNSRVKLTNVADCVERGLVQEGQDPLHVAAEQLTSDGVDVLHTIGGDDTNTTAADLAAYLHENGHDLTVVGLPKTVDNDIVPIRQSLGAWTAAAQGSVFAQNIVAEHSSNPRMLIVHEVMGRHCGWLTAATAEAYHLWVAEQDYVPAIGNDPRRWDVHGVFVPERPIDLHAEADRLRGVMDEIGCVNVFLSEGAGVSEVVAELEAAGQEVPRDPFGHVQLDKVNPGAWFAKQFAELLGAEKTMVQKSGYFSRSAAANARDLALIKECTDLAVDSAMRGQPGVIGHDEERGDELRAIEFPRIKGGKAFDTSVPWFTDLLESIGQV
jgi:diphosphate-dependent phosphofructokinase